MTNRHDVDATWGRSGYIRMGGTPNRRFRLGGELGYRLHQRDGLVTERAIVACTGQYYPTDLVGVFLKAGIGLSVTNEDWEVIPDVVAVGGSYGLGATLGTGIDIPLIAPVSLTPNIDWFGTIGNAGDGEGYSLLLFALGITLQTI